MCFAYGFLCFHVGEFNLRQTQKERGKRSISAERNFLNSLCKHSKIKQMQRFLMVGVMDWQLLSLNEIHPKSVSLKSEDLASRFRNPFTKGSGRQYRIHYSSERWGAA